MVKLGIILSVLALVIAISVFFIPIKLTEDVSWRASVGGTITTALALMLGALALLVTAQVESSAYKAKEQTKTDISGLLATLATIQTKSALWQTGQLESVDLTKESEIILAFSNSTTGFAMHNLAAQKSRLAKDRGEEWRVFFLYIAEMSTMSENTSLMLNRAVRVQELLLSLSEKDLRAIGSSVSSLTSGISDFEKALDENVLIKAVRQSTGEEKDGPDSLGRSELVFKKFQYLKQLGVEDPNIDMFLAVEGNDTTLLQNALNNGADPSITDSAVLNKYDDKLRNFDLKGAESK
ncbi:MAG: hypothetical protein AAF224_14320 [Pseudomonadota bacterium]